MLQVLSRFDFLFQESALGLRRGGWMNWAAISIVTVLLFLLGAGLQTSWQLEHLLNQFGSQLEISVFLKPGVEAALVQPIVQQMPHVLEVHAVPKEEAWNKLVQEMGLSDIRGVTAQLNGIPLVDELEIQAKSANGVTDLVQRLEQRPEVEEVQYLPEVVQRLAQLNRGLSWIGSMVTTILTLTSIAVITTTIRLVVIARQREIEIMQLVGATRAWIYLPFVFQGIAFGLSGAIVAWVLLLVSQQGLASLMRGQPEFIRFLFSPTATQNPFGAVLILPLILLSFGSAVGLLGSVLAVYRSRVR